MAAPARWTLIYLVICFLPSSLCAATIGGLFNTGVDGNGNLLPIGSADPHYALSGPASPAFVIATPRAWVSAPAGSQWIGAISGLSTSPPGAYEYSLSFDLSSADIGNATISGSVSSDNDVAILINGIDIGFTRDVFQFLRLDSFTVDSGFVSGTNTLSFVVINQAVPVVPINPSGLLVANLSGTTGSPNLIPLPGSLAFMATMILSLIGLSLRRSKSFLEATAW